MYTYFPSCNFNKMAPETAKKLAAYLKDKMPKAGCCRVDKKDYSDTTALYFCQACREVLEGKMDCENLFVWLDRQEDLSRMGLWGVRLYFTTENPREVDQVLNSWQNPVPFDPGACTRGLYLRGVE